MFRLWILLILFIVVVLLPVTEAFGIKCPAFNPIAEKPVISDAPRPPSIGLSDKPM